MLLLLALIGCKCRPDGIYCSGGAVGCVGGVAAGSGRMMNGITGDARLVTHETVGLK